MTLPTSAAEAPKFAIRIAESEDADRLLALYYLVYGPTYPLAFGIDRATMLRTIRDRASFLWLVAADPETGVIAGSVLFDIDPLGKIGKVEGLVVHPEQRNQKIASRLVEEGSTMLLSTMSPVNSLYATTRTNSIGVQLIFLQIGYTPLGIFPNAHKLEEYETLTLFAKYKPGVLERRVQVPAVPKELERFIAILEERYAIPSPVMSAEQALLAPGVAAPAETAPVGEADLPGETERQAAQAIAAASSSPLEFELIVAPDFVLRHFNRAMPDPRDRFYPFHTPNLLISAKGGGFDIYAYFSRKDRYCAIIWMTQPTYALTHRWKCLLDPLKELGASYFEILLDLQHKRSIESALDAGFVPSAVYPAMREAGGETHDFAVLSRTMEPLNFRGMAIHRSFKPYIDEYVRLWTQTYLMSLEVHDAS